jgi:hypothetical protein
MLGNSIYNALRLTTTDIFGVTTFVLSFSLYKHLPERSCFQSLEESWKLRRSELKVYQIGPFSASLTFQSRQRLHDFQIKSELTEVKWKSTRLGTARTSSLSNLTKFEILGSGLSEKRKRDSWETEAKNQVYWRISTFSYFQWKKILHEMSISKRQKKEWIVNKWFSLNNEEKNIVIEGKDKM